jgi:hypothetical protein
MKNPKNMKYLQLFESFFELNELMGHLRSIAQKLVQNMPASDSEVTMDNFKIEISLKSDLDDGVKELLAIIRQDGKRVGSIFIDFESPAFPDNIIVKYEIDMENEGVSTNSYSRTEQMDKDLMNSERKKRRPNWRNNLSESLPK